jgi:hypothetical protein
VVPPSPAPLLGAVGLNASGKADPGGIQARSARGGHARISLDLARGLLRGGHGSRGPALGRSAGRTLLSAGGHGPETGRAARQGAVVAYWEHVSQKGEDAEELFSDLFGAL